MSLRGNLGEISIGEVIQTLSLNGHEGTLRIHGETGEKLFYLSKGGAQLIVPGKKAMRMGEALVRSMRITTAQLERVLAEQAKSGKILGRLLVDSGLVTDEDIQAVVRQQFRDEFFEVFLLEKGTFEFLFGVPPDRLVPIDEEFSRVSLDTAGLVLEALRQIDEWKELTKEITTPRAIFRREGKLEDAISAERLDRMSAETRRALDLIDGRRTLEDIVFESGASKFDLYSLVRELIHAGAARPLTHEECRRAGIEAEDMGDTRAAAAFYDFGLAQKPHDLDLCERRFRLAKRLGIYDEAKAAALAIADWRAGHDDPEGALAYYLEAQAIDEKDIRAAEGVFRAYIKLGKSARASRAGDDLVRLAMRQRDFARARDALTTLLALDPENLNRKVEMADIVAEEGRRKEALRLYEAALKSARERRDGAARVAEICRKILALDPKRSDVRALLEKADVLEETRARSRRRRLLVLNLAAVPLILMGTVGLREILARREFAAALASAREPSGMSGAIEQLRSIASRYALTFVARRARERAEALEGELQRIEAEKRAAVIAERARAKEGEAERRLRAVEDLFRHARLMEKKGEFREAASAYFEILRDYPDVPRGRPIRIPIPVSTDPAGARVFRGGEEVGRTPCVIAAEPGKELRLRVEQAGYAPQEAAVLVDRYQEVNISLQRAPLWTVKLDAAIDVAPAFAAGRVIAAARDGEVRAFEAASGRLFWRTRIADWGDGVSPPAVVSGRVFVGTSEGRVVALDSGSGRPLFLAEAGGAVRGEPRAFARGALIGFASSAGLARFVRAADGERALEVPLGSRADAAIAAAGDMAYIGTRGGELWAIALPKGEVRWSFAAKEAVLGAPAVFGDIVIFGTRAGTLIGVGAADGKERWRFVTKGRIRAPIAQSKRLALAASEDGTLLAIEPETGAVRGRFEGSAPFFAAPLVTERAIYAISSDGALAALDPASFSPIWRIALAAPAYASPAAGDGRIYVGTADGLLRAFLE